MVVNENSCGGGGTRESEKRYDVGLVLTRVSDIVDSLPKTTANLVP